MSDLDLLYSDVEDDLRDSLRGLLADRCHADDVTAVYDGNRSLVTALWKALAADLGLAGLLVPEDRGGAGASAREAAVVLEELGRAAAPVPFLTSAVVATTLLLDTESPVLDAMAAADITAALAVPFSVAPFAAIPTVRVDGSRLTGTITSVAGALEADVLMVPAAGITGMAVYAVPAAEAIVAPVISLDMTRQLADVTFHGVAGDLVLANGEHAIRAALEAGAALLAAEQLGVARWCLETTVAYLKDRRQFGRTVGSFQALKHRLADLYTGVESAVAVTRYAAAALADSREDLVIAASVAQAFLSELAVTAGEEAVQLHGGIGMTWEYPAHLYLKKAKADQIAFGTPGSHRARLTGPIRLPSP